MADTPTVFSVQALRAAKDAAASLRRAEEAAAAKQKQEDLKAFTEKVMTYHITEEDKQRALAKIRRAFENGEKDVMIVRFPSEICEDSGRRINNRIEGWQDTLPGVLKNIHEWWEKDLMPGGFTFGARVIDFPGGMPGDIGIFIGWPEREL